MLLIWGQRFYGAVYRIRSLGPVETRFFHLFWFPLVPLASVIRTDAEIYPLSELHWRSIAIAYLRAVLWVVTLVMATTLSRGDVAMLLVFLLSASLLVATYVWMRHATYEQAADIFRHARVSTEDALMMRDSYGKLDPAELARGDRAPADNVLNRMHID